MYIVQKYITYIGETLRSPKIRLEKSEVYMVKKVFQDLELDLEAF